MLQHKAAFDAYVRHGEAHGLHVLEEKALSVGSGPDGGYLVPAETEAAVIRGVKDDLADPRHRRQPRGERVRLQEALRHHRSGDGLGGGDGGAAGDQLADARRALLPDHGALRHAVGDADPARRFGGEYR